jgi:hypothetical protein
MFPFTTTKGAIHRMVYGLLFSFGIAFKHFFKTAKG